MVIILVLLGSGAIAALYLSRVRPDSLSGPELVLTAIGFSFLITMGVAVALLFSGGGSGAFPLATNSISTLVKIGAVSLGLSIVLPHVVRLLTLLEDTVRSALGARHPQERGRNRS